MQINDIDMEETGTPLDKNRAVELTRLCDLFALPGSALESLSLNDLPAIPRSEIRTTELQTLYPKIVKKLLGYNVDDAPGPCPSTASFLAQKEVADAIENAAEDKWDTVEHFIQYYLYLHVAPIVVSLGLMNRLAQIQLPVRYSDIADNAQTAFNSREIYDMGDELEPITCVFHCDSCQNVYWIGTVIKHVMNVHNGSLDTLQVVPPSIPRRLCVDLEIVPTLSSIKRLPGRSGLSLVCRRCDNRVARNMTFVMMVKHYFNHNEWHRLASQAAAIAHLPQIFDDHSTAQNDIRQMVQSEIRRDQRSRNRAWRVFIADIEADPLRRVCDLCPHGYAPLAVQRPLMEIHLWAKHGVNYSVTLAHLQTVQDTTPAHPCLIDSASPLPINQTFEN